MNTGKGLCIALQYYCILLFLALVKLKCYDSAITLNAGTFQISRHLIVEQKRSCTMFMSEPCRDINIGLLSICIPVLFTRARLFKTNNIVS